MMTMMMCNDLMCIVHLKAD